MGSGFNSSDLTEEEKTSIPKLRKRKIQLMDEIEQIKNELKAADEELESLYYVDESSRSRTKLMATGRKKFNQDPWKGIDYLSERGFLAKEAIAVAQWMYKGEGLSKVSIGNVLGSNEQLALEILEEYTNCFNFSDMFILDALRTFLWSFRLPGESQKIDRIMEKFSARYVANCPVVFDTADTCYTISYSCILLNTLLHNPAVKDKPGFDRYIDMNKELVSAGSVSIDTLQAIFDSIKNNEFKANEDDAGDISDILLHAEREGWLYKQSSSQFISGPLSWKRRWFVLSETCLYYFDQTTDKQPRGIIPLQNVGVKKVEAAARPHMFEIFSLSDELIKSCKSEQDGRRVRGRHSVYRMCAANNVDLQSWIDAISNAVKEYPVRPRSTQ